MTEIERLHEALEKEARAVVDETLYRGEGYELVRSMDKVLDQIAALSTPPAAEWQTVPIEPTEEMITAAVNNCDLGADGCGPDEVYRAMLKAAPPSPRTPEGQG